MWVAKMMQVIPIKSIMQVPNFDVFCCLKSNHFFSIEFQKNLISIFFSPIVRGHQPRHPNGPSSVRCLGGDHIILGKESKKREQEKGKERKWKFHELSPLE